MALYQKLYKQCYLFPVDETHESFGCIYSEEMKNDLQKKLID